MPNQYRMRPILFLLFLCSTQIAFGQSWNADPVRKSMDAGQLARYFWYPGDLVHKKSGCVVYSIDKGTEGKLVPVKQYASDDRLDEMIDSVFTAHPQETYTLLDHYKNDILIFEFITYSEEDNQKIYPGENRQLFNKLSGGRKQYFLKIESGYTLCIKKALSPNDVCPAPSNPAAH